MKHPCIKPGCATVYEDNEPDHYYCPEHVEEKKRIAAELDKKLASQPRERSMSALEMYDAEAKVIQGPNGRTISFARTKL